MAVSVPHYLVIRDLYRYGMLPQGGALLEIGEADWYYDIRPLSMIDDINRFVTDPVRRDALVARLKEIVETQPETYRFDIVKVYYELYFSPSEIQAIDFDGTPLACKYLMLLGTHQRWWAIHQQRSDGWRNSFCQPAYTIRA